MFGFIWTLIIGGIIGAIAQALVGRDIPGGIIGNIILGIVGANVGGWLLSNFGPSLGGIAIVPAILGGVILVFLYDLIAGRS